MLRVKGARRNQIIYCFCVFGCLLVLCSFAPLLSTSVVLPYSCFEGEWYGPGVQNSRILRRLVQTHLLRPTSRSWYTFGAQHQQHGLAANKLGGDWARGDVGARGELLWRVHSDAEGLQPCGPGVRGEVQVSMLDGGKMEKAALIAISRDHLLLVCQQKTLLYHRAGACGLETVFQCVDERAIIPLHRVFFNYASKHLELIKTQTPVVDISHLWRARGALAIVVAASDKGHAPKPSNAVLSALRSMKESAPADPFPPRLVFIWPWHAEDRAEIEFLAEVKNQLGDKSEVYVDETGAVAKQFAHHGTSIHIWAIGTSGHWQSMQTDGSDLDEESFASFQSNSIPLWQNKWITRFNKAKEIRAYPREVADGETPTTINWVRQ